MGQEVEEGEVGVGEHVLLQSVEERGAFVLPVFLRGQVRSSIAHQGGLGLEQGVHVHLGGGLAREQPRPLLFLLEPSLNIVAQEYLEVLISDVLIFLELIEDKVYLRVLNFIESSKEFEEGLSIEPVHAVLAVGQVELFNFHGVLLVLGIDLVGDLLEVLVLVFMQDFVELAVRQLVHVVLVALFEQLLYLLVLHSPLDELVVH